MRRITRGFTASLQWLFVFVSLQSSLTCLSHSRGLNEVLLCLSSLQVSSFSLHIAVPSLGACLLWSLQLCGGECWPRAELRLLLLPPWSCRISVAQAIRTCLPWRDVGLRFLSLLKLCPTVTSEGIEPDKGRICHLAVAS